MSLLLPNEIITNSPSLLDNIPSSIEMIHRVYGCELIQEAGILFRQPQVVMCTAQNIFHRFFYRKSFKNYDAFTVAMGCTLLASKVEEKPKIIRDIVFIFHHIYQRRKKLKRKILSPKKLNKDKIKYQIIFKLYFFIQFLVRFTILPEKYLCSLSKNRNSFIYFLCKNKFFLFIKKPYNMSL